MIGETLQSERSVTGQKVFEETPRMYIQVNGDSRNVRAEMNVTGLLQDLQLNAEQVAVEINLEILEKQAFDARMLQEGDRIEIMSFIGGGAPCPCVIPTVC